MNLYESPKNQFELQKEDKNGNLALRSYLRQLANYIECQLNAAGKID